MEPYGYCHHYYYLDSWTYREAEWGLGKENKYYISHGTI